MNGLSGTGRKVELGPPADSPLQWPLNSSLLRVLLGIAEVLRIDSCALVLIQKMLLPTASALNVVESAL